MIKQISFLLAAIILFSSAAFPEQNGTAQSSPTIQKSVPSSSGPVRISFSEAQGVLGADGAPEGNLRKKTETYSLTRLKDGRVLEIFYPHTPTTRRSARSPKSASLSGYGVLHQSEAAWRESMRPRHILEDLLPDAQVFVTQVPDLVTRLERRLRIGKLDYSRASLKRVDAFVSSYRNSHSTADTDQAVFQQVTAYYGEVLRRETAGEWVVSNESIAQKNIQRVPNIRFERNGVRIEKRPWSTVLNILSNEDNHRPSLAAAWDADLRAGSE